MSTGEDSSFEELSYKYDFDDEYSSAEFVLELDDVCEDTTEVVVELPLSLLELNDSEHLLPPEVERTSTEDRDASSHRSLVESSTPFDPLLSQSSPAYVFANSEKLNAVSVEEVGYLLSHVDTRRGATPQESFSTDDWSSFMISTPESTTDSNALTDYDIISVGGSIKRLCKRCTFIGNENECFCGGCGLAWCANPSPDVDALIAAQMRFKEEESFHDMIQNEEAIREKLRDQPAPVQAQMLTNDILRFVDGFAMGSDNDGVCLRSITEYYLYMLAMEFIVDFINCRDSKNTFLSEIRLYYHVSSSREVAAILRGDGFLHSTILVKNLETAYQKAKTRRCSSEEEESSDEDVSYLGWIVAISHHEHVYLTNLDDDSEIIDDTRWKIEDSTDKDVVYTSTLKIPVPVRRSSTHPRHRYSMTSYYGLGTDHDDVQPLSTLQSEMLVIVEHMAFLSF